MVYAAPAAVAGPAMVSASPNQGTVVVQAPTDAQVYVDDYRMNQTSATRTFTTPALQPGATYYYTIRAEATRDGKKVEASKRVTVRAGEVSRVAFADMSNSDSGSGVVSRITIRAPEGARLFVDGKVIPSTSAPRIFDTPRLTPGYEYSYNFRAELVRDGQTRSEEKRVTFEAGKPVTVDFSDMTTVATASR
jgi:uncharacterized protein (TIGR03000 family)